MKYGVLEVLLVSGEGLKKTHLLGSSSQYVVIQCGNRTCISKTSTGKNEKVWWNEKITFKLSSSQWKALTQLRITVMEKDKFTLDHPIGEAIVHLRAILREGEKKGHMELKPAPYNVVLKDGSYEGELKLGFKFISNVEGEFLDDEKDVEEAKKHSQSFYCTIFNIALWHIRWPRFFNFRKESKCKHK